VSDVQPAPADKSAANVADIFKIPLLVGVVGHRDLVPTQVPDIREAVRKLLQALSDAESDLRVKLLSSMADGADLLVADVASELGIDVIALLPYSATQCRKDLETDAARAVFDRIMARAERLEMPLSDGRPADDTLAPGDLRDRQYQRAGALIAQYSSLLVAIWDGRETDHRAGTSRVVDFRRRGIAPPDNASAPGDPLRRVGDNDLIYEIRCSRANARSGAAAVPAARIEVLGFVTVEKRAGTIEDGIPSALSTLLERTAGFNRDVSDYRAQIGRRGRRLAPPTPYMTPEPLIYVDRLFMAADWLGVHFRRCFARALRARYALWATLAFLLLAFKKERADTFAFASIVGVLTIFGLGWLLAFWAHARSWHRRYLDYRALAEGLRVEFYWEIAGVRLLEGGEFAHESFLQHQDVELEWIRAAMRAVSLRCALYPRTVWPEGFAHTFAAWVGDPDPVNGSGQLLYYRHRRLALERRQELAELTGRALVIAGLAFGILLAIDAALNIVAQPILSEVARSVMIWGLALLTVYGAIFEIYLGEKADRALIRQYRYMDSLFSFAAREMRSARSSADKLQILQSLGHACLAEHAQWILAHRDKRIEGMRW
jgi:hypothetical protein